MLFGDTETPAYSARPSVIGVQSTATASTDGKAPGTGDHWDECLVCLDLCAADGQEEAATLPVYSKESKPQLQGSHHECREK